MPKNYCIMQIWAESGKSFFHTPIVMNLFMPK